MTTYRLAVLVLLASCSPGTPTPPGGCKPNACEPGQCGELSDGCTGILRCGACESGLTCGGGGTPNVCAAGTCSPKTCFELAKNCNFVSDGCSKLLDCGRCMRPTDCGAGGKPNVCGGVSCVRSTCGDVCGTTLSDDCGGLLSCDGGCANPFDTCSGGGVPNRCGCIPQTCASLAKNCGQTSDGCGNTIQCGSCGPDAGTCGGGGAENVCGTCGNAGGRVCSGSCWCFEDPRPIGAPLGAITGTGPDDVWLLGGAGLFAHATPAGVSGSASGVRGTARNAWARSADDVWVATSQVDAGLSHWDGVAWSTVQLPAAQQLSGVWGVGDVVWAAGNNGIVLRRVNGTWSTVAMGSGYAFEDVWASAADDVWVAGTSTRHFDGTALSPVAALTLRVTDMHGTARDDVWAVDVQAVRHFDGAAWSSSYTRYSMRRVWAIARNDVWVGGASGRVAHHDGSTWSDEQLGTNEEVTALWASGPNDVWVGTTTMLFRRDARGWRLASTAPVNTVRALWAAGPNEAWATHDNGVLRFDGALWRPITIPTSAGVIGLSGAGERVWVAGAGNTLLSWRDGGFVSEAPAAATGETWSRVHAVSPREAYVVGSFGGRLYRTDGEGSWSPMETPGTAFNAASALWASSDDDLWVGASSGRLHHLTDAGWSTIVLPSSTPVRGLWGSGDELFAVTGASIQRRGPDGGFSALFVQNGLQLHAVWGRSPTEVYFAGTGGTLLRWDGAVITNVSVPGVTTDLYAVAGDPTSTVWAGGLHHTIVRADAGRDPVVQARLGDTLSGVMAFGARDVWAIGATGQPKHFDGQSWHTFPVTNGAGLDVLWGHESGDVWAIGAGGRIAHWDGGTFSPAVTPLGSGTLNAVWGAQSNEVWVVGESGVGRWNGLSWVSESLPRTAFSLAAVHGSARDDVWAGGMQLFHFNGMTWRFDRSLTKQVTSLWCSSRSDCWAVGPTPVTMRFNGTSWSELPTSPCRAPSVVWGRSANDVYVFCTDGDAWRWDGVKFSRSYTGAVSPVLAVSGTDAGSWAVTRDSVLFRP